MKRLIIAALSITMLLSFAGCKKDAETQKEDTNTATTNAEATLTDSTEDPNTRPTLNVVFPTDTEIATEQETFYDNGRVEGPEYDPFEDME